MGRASAAGAWIDPRGAHARGAARETGIAGGCGVVCEGGEGTGGEMMRMQLAEERQTDLQSRWGGLRSTRSLAVLGVVLPAVIFYSILFSQVVNIPDLDDYWALLDFLNKMV